MPQTKRRFKGNTQTFGSQVSETAVDFAAVCARHTRTPTLRNLTRSECHMPKQTFRRSARLADDNHDDRRLGAPLQREGHHAAVDQLLLLGIVNRALGHEALATPPAGTKKKKENRRGHGGHGSRSRREEGREEVRVDAVGRITHTNQNKKTKHNNRGYCRQGVDR